MTVSNIFVAIETDAPPPQVTSRSDHPVPRIGIQTDGSTPLETNKFYANFFLGGQTNPTWTHPYSVSWSKGSGAYKSWGLAVAHTERSQLTFGPPNTDAASNPPRYFISPIGIQSLILSAAQLDSNALTTLTTDSLNAFSVNVNLASGPGLPPLITFPLVQGMGFVTGVYKGAIPEVQSGVAFKSVTYVGPVASGKTYKYRAILADDTQWLIYVSSDDSSYAFNAFTLINNMCLQGPANFNGWIQVTKLPASTSNGEAAYDKSAGAYPTSAKISGSVQGSTGTYTLSWTKQGVVSQTLLMYALPHHSQSFTSATVGGQTDMVLETTTKGLATAVVADSWTLSETDLPTNMDFAPWSPSRGSVKTLSSSAISLMNTAGEAELSQDISQQTNLNSMYFSGKGLAKFAAIVYAIHDIAGNASLALAGLQKLEDAFSVFVNNAQTFPLVYDSAWKGAVSSGTYSTGDSNLDFGNTYYNDHHFHYGYFVYTAAVIGYLNPTWLDQGTNRAWVNMLVRDYANPISDDSYFPFSRSFDWFHGHSWAKGLFDSADGKDQESSSEDTMASYAIKMWGRTVNDTNMEARGNLMLAIQARSLRNYYLLESNNTVQPPVYIGNKAAGILFENKIDHTTYFGTSIEYIEGIHMIPQMPFSAFTRSASFVREEWDTYFSNGRVDSVAGGWRGILYANLAIIDPSTSYNFFANQNFDYGLLDGGASRTWYLAYSAGLGGALGNAKRDVLSDGFIGMGGQTGPYDPNEARGDSTGKIERKHRIREFLQRLS
ncbi:endo-1,3-beta glucanase [Elasticomyces elasticus]|nr:endo-1,3-beta glucanase [Elasticomyces elasticus]